MNLKNNFCGKRALSLTQVKNLMCLFLFAEYHVKRISRLIRYNCEFTRAQRLYA